MDAISLVDYWSRDNARDRYIAIRTHEIASSLCSARIKLEPFSTDFTGFLRKPVFRLATLRSETQKVGVLVTNTWVISGGPKFL